MAAHVLDHLVDGRLDVAGLDAIQPGPGAQGVKTCGFRGAQRLRVLEVQAHDFGHGRIAGDAGLPAPGGAAQFRLYELGITLRCARRKAAVYSAAGDHDADV